MLVHNYDEAERRRDVALAEGFSEAVMDRGTGIIEGVIGIPKTLENGLEILTNPRESAEKSIEALKSIRDTALYVIENPLEVSKL